MNRRQLTTNRTPPSSLDYAGSARGSQRQNKRSAIKKLPPIITVLLILAACNDILAPDISGKSVVVISPADKTATTAGTVSFRWNALQGAEKYRVTVVSPGFASARLVARDTVFYQDSLASVMSFGFNLTLAPAEYQWSIQAFNYAYESKKSVCDLTVIAPEKPEEEPEIR